MRFVRTLGPYTVVCLELPHQVRTVQWLTDDSQAAFGAGAQYQQVRLAFPYIVVIVTFWDGALTGQQQLFYRRTALQSADDPLCFPSALPALPSASAFSATGHYPFAWRSARHALVGGRRG